MLWNTGQKLLKIGIHRTFSKYSRNLPIKLMKYTCYNTINFKNNNNSFLNIFQIIRFINHSTILVITN